MKIITITMLALLILAPSGMADEQKTTPTLEEDSRQMQKDLYEYEKALQQQKAFLAQVREEKREDELHQLQEARKAYQEAQEGLRAEKHEMETRKRKHLDQLRTLKLLELLDLDENQELEFIHVFQSMRRKHRELHNERMETIEELSRSLEENSVTSNEITRALGKIDELDSKDHTAKRRFHDQASAILSPDQMGKLIVFQAKFEHEILNQLREFRGRGMGRGPRGQIWEPFDKGEHLRRFGVYMMEPSNSDRQ